MILLTNDQNAALNIETCKTLLPHDYKDVPGLLITFPGNSQYWAPITLDTLQNAIQSKGVYSSYLNIAHVNWIIFGE